MAYSKHKDVEAVMVKAASDLKLIEAEYHRCLDKQTIPDALLVEVKDCFANLRSALDYSWSKIPGASTGGYFPLAGSATDLAGRTSGIDQKYRAVADAWQPYNGKIWTGHFNFLRNKNAHLTLIPQTRQETREFSVKAGSASATFRNVTFGKGVRIAMGGIPMPIDHDSQFPVDTHGLDIRRTIWIDFHFDATSIDPNFPKGISALPFLRESFSNVAQIISELEKT